MSTSLTGPVYIDSTALMRGLLTPERAALAPGLSVYAGDPTPDEVVARVGTASAVLNGHTVMDRALLERLPNLKRIVFLGTGAGSYIDLAAAQTLGIELRTIHGYGDRSVAEHTIALLFAAARGICQQDGALRRGLWDPLDGIQLSGRVLGVIGAGGIGKEVIHLGAAIGMRVLVHARTPPTGLPCEAVPLSRLLAESDAVSLHLALTPDTAGFFDKETFAAMKPGAILVNTARGGLVDEAALCAALQSGQLGHAALDVFQEEPLLATDTLLTAPRTTLTSHCGYKTPEAAIRLLESGLRLLSA